MNEPGREGSQDIRSGHELPPVTNEFTPLFYDRSRLSHPFNNEAFRLEDQYLDIFYVYVGELLGKAVSSGQQVFESVNDALAEGVAEAMSDVAIGKDLLEKAQLTFDALPTRLQQAMSFVLEKRADYRNANDEIKRRLARRAFMSISQALSDYMLDIREDLRSVVLTNLIGNGYLGEDARKKLDLLDFQASLRSDPKLGVIAKRVATADAVTPVVGSSQENSRQNNGKTLKQRVISWFTGS